MATFEELQEALRASAAPAPAAEGGTSFEEFQALLKQPETAQPRGGAAGLLEQIPAGFNRRLGELLGGASQIDPMRLGAEAISPGLGEFTPARAAARFLSERGPEPQTATERAGASGGEFLAETLLAGGPLFRAAQMGGQALHPLIRPLVEGIRQTPGIAGGAEVAAGIGAGIGGQVAEEAGAGPTGRFTGELMGGLAPVAATMGPVGMAVRQGRRMLGRVSPEAQRQAAREHVAGELGDVLETPGVRSELERAQELRKTIPGFEPSLGEATGLPSVVRTQQGIEGRARGPELDRLAGRRAANVEAVESFARQRGAELGEPLGAEAALDPLRQRVQRLGGQIQRDRGALERRIEGLEGQRARLDEARRQTRERLGEERGELRTGAAEQREDLAERATDLAAQRAQVQAETPVLREEAEAAFRRRAEEVAARLPRIDRGEIGERLRERVEALRDLRREEMGELAQKLGIADADVSVSFGRFAEKAELAFTDVLPSERGFLPRALQNIRHFAERQSQPRPIRDPEGRIAGFGQESVVTFKEIKAIREHLGDEIRDLAASTSPADRKRLRNAVKLRQMIDDDLLGSGIAEARPDLAEAYQTFRQRYFEDYIKPFERGAAAAVRRRGTAGFHRTESEDVAAAFFAPGNQTAARDFRELFKNDPEAMADMASVALDSLADATLRDGVIRPGALETWLTRNRSNLQELPDVHRAVAGIAQATVDVETARRSAVNAIRRRNMEEADRLGREATRLRRERTEVGRTTRERTQQVEGEAATALEQLENADRTLTHALQPLLERRAVLHQRQQSLEDTILARRLHSIERGGQRPEDVVRRALDDPRLMMKIWNGLRGDDDARRALRRHLWDDLSDPMDAGSLDRALREHRGSLRIALGDRHLRDLEALRDALKMIDRVPAPLGKEISPEPLQDVIESAIGIKPRSLVSRYVNMKALRLNPRVIGTEIFGRFASAVRRKESERLMREAVYSPEIASDLAEMARLGRATPAARRRLRAWLVNAGVSAAVEDVTDQPRE